MSVDSKQAEELKAIVDKALVDIEVVLKAKDWTAQDSVEGVKVANCSVEGFGTYMWKGELGGIKATPEKFLKLIERVITEDGFIN